MSKQKLTPVQPDVSLFDYQKLSGEEFTNYQKVVKELLANEKYDFEVWLASSVIKKKFDEDTGGSYSVMSGIKLNGNKPIMVTKITARQAQELNNHVSHILTQEYKGTSKYYLLAKKENVELARKESEVEHA